MTSNLDTMGRPAKAGIDHHADTPTCLCRRCRRCSVCGGLISRPAYPLRVTWPLVCFVCDEQDRSRWEPHHRTVDVGPADWR